MTHCLCYPPPLRPHDAQMRKRINRNMFRTFNCLSQGQYHYLIKWRGYHIMSINLQQHIYGKIWLKYALDLDAQLCYVRFSPQPEGLYHSFNLPYTSAEDVDEVSDSLCGGLIVSWIERNREIHCKHLTIKENSVRCLLRCRQSIGRAYKELTRRLR